ncbi:putative TraR/DksA family transcriptional regulator [Magnetofaba australis IT-1]|uniref:RNA polymerase-binding transcription factor DksA n=1 Tax=Magnetofaba australis IT-1 TaxID=1434232 RepID=A0A1Y2JYU1_9PROT|nr:putative TraR/DksA family transcriptional regulator [Magnetofaba australis IT-1]
MKIEEIQLPEGYKPSDDEEYMNPTQRAYFRMLLLEWKQQLLQDADKTVHVMGEEKAVFADPTDRATLETDRNFELRTRDRERKLVNKIDRTIEVIKADEYGFCDACGVEIGLRRLEARPVTDLCIDCKTKEEQMEKTRRNEDDDDED